MNITGIIAEYNPFHNGHRYQVDAARKNSDADYVIAVMSGNFLQRGTPAVLDKFTRAEAALQNGVDLVIELPAIWAVSSAENFARASVSLFQQLGSVTGLSFGCEADDISLLKEASLLLNHETAETQADLQAYLKAGESFPAARAKMLAKHMSLNIEETDSFSSEISSPNNILALEYLRALDYFHSDIQPFPIKRAANGYHDTTLSSPYASASAIRHYYEQERNALTGYSHLDAASHEHMRQTLSAVMPDSSLDLLLQSEDLVLTDDFSLLLHYLLLAHTPDTLMQYSDSNLDLCHRICRLAPEFTTLSEFILKCKTKNMTHTRISRFLTHVLLNIRTEQMETAKKLNYVPYARILGFRRSSAPLLSVLKKNSSIPLITSAADAKQTLSSSATAILESDIYASDIYHSALSAKTKKRYKNDYETSCIIV